jgi:hypothetical protein
MNNTRRPTRAPGQARENRRSGPPPGRLPDFTVRPFGRCGPLDPDQAERSVVRRWSLRESAVRSQQRDDLE